MCTVAFFRKLLGNCNVQGDGLPQAIGELQCARWRFAASYWGIAICGVTVCSKLFGNCTVHGGVLPQAVGDLQFAR